jgi:hypothetical protein
MPSPWPEGPHAPLPRGPLAWAWAALLVFAPILALCVTLGVVLVLWLA